jgi:hypothetical protein
LVREQAHRKTKFRRARTKLRISHPHSATVRTPKHEGRISAISACLCMDERGRSSLAAARTRAATAPEIGSEFP